jgi:hypothetical protein
LETVGQLGVIKAEQVQQGRMQIVHVNLIPRGVKAELVDSPSVKPGFTPPPANHMEKQLDDDPRPSFRPAPWACGRTHRPKITKVSSSNPRCLRSATRAAHA